MTGAGQDGESPEVARSIAGNVSAIILRTMTMVLELEAMIIAPASFATIGSAVASANARMQGQQIAALRSLLLLLQQVSTVLTEALDDNEPVPDTARLWTSPIGGRVAASAAGASVGLCARPDSVRPVLDCLNAAGLGAGVDVPAGSPRELVAWLDADPMHQVDLGVLGVYNGTARGFGDVPGGVHDGDIVVIDPNSGGSPNQIGVIADSGLLYNNGLLRPDFGDVATLRVYRPM